MKLSIRVQRQFVMLVAAVVLGVFSGVVSGCASGSGAAWPTVQVVPQEAPADLEVSSGTPKLVRGSDGFWYVVGVLGADVQTGSAFMARYSGDWPLENVPRPALAGGRVVKRLGDQVALVGMTYWFPKTELETLEVTWEEVQTEEALGKGVGVVTAIRSGAIDDSGWQAGDLASIQDFQINIGKDGGAQVGDVYAILQSVDEGGDAVSLQLSRRLSSICRVHVVGESSSDCVQWAGSGGVSGAKKAAGRAVAVGDEVLFLEHTLNAPARDAQILITQVAADPKIRDVVMEVFAGYLADFAGANTKVLASDLEVDARDMDFHRVGRQLNYDGSPTLLVGFSVHDVKGRAHLFANYTGVGPATGPGMIAAPPEGGVDLGEVKKLNREVVRGFASVVMGGVMVYRGQTSEAMMHLKEVLQDASVQGPLRWHARDQFAMRWGALRYHEEALWLVMEDEAVAQARGDELARLNALGTRVRLHDFMNQKEKAFEESRAYLEARKDQKPNSAYLSALAMNGEMALGAGKEEVAREVVAELRALCPDGCDGDLLSFLSGIYWSAGAEHLALQSEVLGYLIELARQAEPGQRAAVRLYQGFQALQEREFEQGLIAFLEAERLFELAQYPQSRARTLYFMSLTELAREEPQAAFEVALKALELNTETQNYAGILSVYEHLANLYRNLDLRGPMHSYLGMAGRVLPAAVQAQLAAGDYGAAAETMFITGGFFFQIGSADQSQLMFQQTVWYGLRSARFDIVAMSHLFLAMIARGQGDLETFREEIQRAILMGEVANDPEIMETIQNVISPPPADDVPTQLL